MVKQQEKNLVAYLGFLRMKKYINSNVLTEARNRISFVFDNFEKIYLSFSGGKDSTVMLHLVMDEAIKRKRKIGVLFIDLEGQYKLTIDHINEMFNEYSNMIYKFHICLPIILRNAVSVYEPRWICWDPGKEWIREMPKDCISDQRYFSFFKYGMEFEEFTPAFGKWYSKDKLTACFVGIRSDESLNRYRTIVRKNKTKYKNKNWTTWYGEWLYNIYPIYDWRTRDIWIYNYKFKKRYNHLYDLMTQAGLTIHQQRICQPYGDDQRKGLWLFQIIEPETWAKVVARVAGANSGKEFVKYSGSVSGQIKISKPDNITWQKFCKIIISSNPEKMSEHYRNKIFIYLRWYEERGYRHGIPDENSNGKEDKKSPSWKRICKMLLRNDYWAKTLSFSQTKTGYFYTRYMKRIRKDRDRRKRENMRKAGYWKGFE
jgi:predicted phosphoadenosine phosphosulfate sulfurtransferase